ncbi:MAG TPA: NADH-quinone oxidoreductase subunit NuoE [Thermogutta sp.]|nr:NADH-quinone oxidoreductase subunit NuoE [Thermogutta sp.]
MSLIRGISDRQSFPVGEMTANAVDRGTATVDLNIVDEIVERCGRKPEAAIPILQAIQAHFRYLPQEALERVCQLTEIRPSQLIGVATFYGQFRFRPVGRHIIHVCHGTACHVKGAERIQEALERHLGLRPGEDTDPEGLFTVEKVACLGCCTLAPVIQIDRSTYGRLTPAKIPRVLADFLHAQSNGSHPSRGPSAGDFEEGEVRVGLGSCCQAQGSAEVYRRFEELVTLAAVPISIKRVGCVGMCHQTPLVEVVPRRGKSQVYAKVEPDDVPAIVHRHFRPRKLWSRLRYGLNRWLDHLLGDIDEDALEPQSLDVRDPPVCAFLGRQLRIATELAGEIDPLSLDEYLAHGGFKAAERAVKEWSAEQIIEEVKRSGLRGRGGAGFPTAEKWTVVRKATGEPKYVTCNGDEGDPGAFMDRMILESFPYRVIEGMLIAAKAVGAHEGIFYIRAEYPLAVERVRAAIHTCEERGILGDRVLGTDFRFHLRVNEGAGAFVCGEETALIASMEGRRGMPRLRPPYPAEFGFGGRPTLVNNVETFALVPWIIRHGAERFARLGTATSKGTKVFALAGKVRRGGLIEVPMGITLREIIEEIGGGALPGRRIKAVQVGGPSGGCVSEALFDTPVDYEALTATGAIMGSGGLIVLDNTDCMVDIARYFLRFTQDQSCGKCTLCRIGTRRMLEILERICNGEGRAGDLEVLEDLARTVSAGSLCGLGKTAPNPVLTTLRYFREEYEAHLRGECPAGKCSPLIRYVIADQCIGCTLCAQNCPVGAIPLRPYRRHAVDDAKCTRCDTCRLVCPIGAVVVESGGRVVAYGPMAQTNSTTSPGGPTSASGGTCATLPQFVPLSEGRSGIVATATSQNSGRAL